MKFIELNLSEQILKPLAKIRHEDLTEIQQRIITSIQSGKDVLGYLRITSSKIVAFLLPILSRLISDKKQRAVIIVPTKQLALQIMGNVKSLLDNKNIDTALILGGLSTKSQLMPIQKDPKLIVGTVRKVIDLLNSEKLDISKFNILVLDEVDKLFSSGFSSKISEIVEKIAKNKQVIAFSSADHGENDITIKKYLKDPIIINTNNINQLFNHVNQEFVNIDNSRKFDKLLKTLRANNGFTMIFVKTEYTAEKLVGDLAKKNILAKVINSDLRKAKRTQIIESFRNKKFNILIATDIAVIEPCICHVDNIINYDLPTSFNDYIRKIEACFGIVKTKANVISFYNKKEEELLKSIKSGVKNSDDSASISLNRTKQPIKKDKVKSMKIKQSIRNGILENSSAKSRASSKSFRRKDSGYDIEGLMSTNQKGSSRLKKPASYLISKTTAAERRKRLGL